MTKPEVIVDPQGNRVAEMSRKSGILDGTCTWFDRRGEVLTIGCFKQGKPFSGTFLNWSRFLPPEKGLGDFDWEYYAKDWITLFESSFDSTEVDYSLLVEAYMRGKIL